MIYLGSTCRIAAAMAGLMLLAACQPQAVVDVETTPNHARVYLNGKYIGKSPVKAEIRDRNAPGEDIWEHHVIRAEADGYLISRKDLKYRQGAPWLPEVVHLRLEPDPNSPLPGAYVDPAMENRPKAKWVHVAKPRKDKPESPIASKPPVISKPEIQPETPPTSQPAKTQATTPETQPAASQPASQPTPQTQPASSQPASKPAIPPEITSWPSYPKPVPPPLRPATQPTEKTPLQPAPETQPASPSPATQPGVVEKPKKNLHESPVPRELPTDKSLAGTSPWNRTATWDPTAPMPPLKKMEDQALPLRLRPKGVPRKSASLQTKLAENSTPTTQPAVSRERRPLPPHQLAAGITSPWQKVLPHIRVKSSAEIDPDQETVAPPRNSRRLICELRLVRVRDGHVVAQASAPAVYRNLPKLADVLLANLEVSMPDTPPAVAAITLCNRRQSPQGKLVCKEMNALLAERLQKSSTCKFIETIDFRPVLKTEIQLENASDISNAETLHLLKDAEYVILGGLALEAIPTSIQPKPQVRRRASRRSQY